MKTLTHNQPSPSIQFAPYLLSTAEPGAFSLWLARQRQRIHLSQLDKHMLDDIGVSRIEAHSEARRWD